MTDDPVDNSVDAFNIPPSAGDDDELPAWLKEIAPPEPSDTTTEPVLADDPAGEDLPAWLRELTPPAGPLPSVPPTSSIALPDLPPDIPPADRMELDQPGPSQTVDINAPTATDGTASANAPMGTDVPQEPAFAPLEPGKLAEPAAELSPDSPEAPEADSPARPDWLSQLPSPVGESPAELQTPGGVLEQESLPAWLREFAQPPDVPQVAAEPETGAPSWLAEQPLHETAAPEVEQTAASEPDTPGEHHDLQADEPLPAVRSTAEEPAASNVDEPEPTMPDWARELTPPTGATQDTFLDESGLDQSDLDGLPDWLRETPLTSVGIKRGSVEPVPSWNGAVKSPVGESLPELTETSGPLAGVRGVLPIAHELTLPQSAPASSPIRANGARVFESVLAPSAASTSAAPAMSADRTVSPWVHFGIYLVVFLAAFVALFVPADMAGLGLTVNNQTPTAGFHDRMQTLGAGSTVLLAFDYDTGQTVELNPAARAIVGDLAHRQINVIAVSTTLVGAQIAQSILREAAQQNPNWQYGTNFINVGYVPGAESGLRGLTENWLPASRLDFDKQFVRSLPLGMRVRSLGDLALVVEIAGKDEVLRWWMEQVQPHSRVPVIAAVSAGVEPSARTYRDAKQLAAFLRGLQGAAEYELFSNQPSLSVHTVDAQSFTQLVVAGIIILGNLVFLFGRLQKKGLQTSHGRSL